MGTIGGIEPNRGEYSVSKLQDLKAVLRRFAEGATPTLLAKLPKEATPKAITNEDAQKLLAVLEEEMGHIPPHVEAMLLAPQASELRKELYAAFIYHAPKAAQKLCSESVDPETKASMNRLFYSLLETSRT
jgi:hypothetical protein